MVDNGPDSCEFVGVTVYASERAMTDESDTCGLWSARKVFFTTIHKSKIQYAKVVSEMRMVDMPRCSEVEARIWAHGRKCDMTYEQFIYLMYDLER